MTEKKESTKVKSMAMPSGPDDEPVLDLFESEEDKKQKLKLDYQGQKPAKSRQQLYNDLKRDEKFVSKDSNVYATPLDRAVAFILDILFLFLLYKVLILLVPAEEKILEWFMDRYNVQFMLGNHNLSKVLMGINAVFTFYIAFVIPTSFYNRSLGKRVFGLKVRGDQKYAITLKEAFLREVICKPISILCVVGLIMPFVHKRNKSLHDRMVGTIVIKV